MKVVGQQNTAQSSPEKLAELLTGAGQLTPSDENQAQAFAMLRIVAPMMRSQIPDDPEELDGMLLTLARWAITLRSDWADRPETVAELLVVEQVVEAEAIEEPGQ